LINFPCAGRRRTAANGFDFSPDLATPSGDYFRNNRELRLRDDFRLNLTPGDPARGEMDVLKINICFPFDAVF